MKVHKQTCARHLEKLQQVRDLLGDAERQQYIYGRAIDNYGSPSSEESSDDSLVLLKYVEPKRRAIEKFEPEVVAIINNHSPQGGLNSSLKRSIKWFSRTLFQ